MKIVSENDLTGRWQAPAMGAVSQSKFYSIILDENITIDKKVWKHDKSRDQYIEQFDFPYCEEVSKYEKQAKIGQVSHGK